MKKIKKDYIIISDSKGWNRIPCQEIIRLEANKNYTIVHRTMGRQYVCSKNIGAMEKKHLTKKKNFIKVHKSHIINMNNMEKYEKQDGGIVIMNDNSVVKVAKKRKAYFNRLLKQY